jgi:hypothetical protein
MSSAIVVHRAQMLGATPAAEQLATVNQDLGVFASAVESAPEATLTGLGIVLGALWGGIAGWAASSLVSKQNRQVVILAGAGLGAAILGVEGYSKGKELDVWLQANS